MRKAHQHVARKLAMAVLAPVAVLAAQHLPRSVFATAKVLGVDDRASEGLVTEATSALRDGKHRPGRTLGQALLAHAPLDSHQRGVLHRELGRFHHVERQHEESISHLRSAVAQLPCDKEAAELLIRAAVATEDPIALQEVLPRADLSDLSPAALNEAFTILAEAGDWGTVLATIDHSELSESTLVHIATLADRLAEPGIEGRIDDRVQSELDGARIWLERGRQLESDGQLDGALTAYEVALRRPEPSASTWYRAGRLHLRIGNDAAAERYLAEAVRLKPHRPRWRYALGRALLAVGRSPEAVTELTRAIELGSRNDRRHAVALARARRRAGVAAPDADREVPSPPSLGQLRGIDVGIVAPLTGEAVVGWLLDQPGAERRVTIEVNGLPVTQTRASTPITLADGRAYLAFRRTVRDLWSFLGTGDVVSVTVDGEPLPIVGAGERLVIELDRPSCVVGLEDQLERGYVLNKYGRIRRSIRHNQRWQDGVITLFHELRADVREAIGADLFPFYGTLLGAVRENDFLGHDNDFDTAYISRGTTPSEVHHEFLRLCAHLIERGHRIEARAWHIWVGIPGTRSRLDISFCWFDEEDRFQAGYGYHGDAAERSELSRVDQPVRLGDHELLAPANSERLLAQLYGPGWQHPDPGFSHYRESRVQDLRYRIPWALRYEVLRRQFDYDQRSAGDPTFVDWVADQSPPPARVIELECGYGYDSLDFAARGYEVVASSSSNEALAHATDAHRRALPQGTATFYAVDASDRGAVQRFLDAATAGLPAGRPLIVCLRGGAHAVATSLQVDLLQIISESVHHDLTLYLEWWMADGRAYSEPDRGPGSRSEGHEEAIDQLASNHDFQVRHVNAITARSTFRGEHPHVARTVAHRHARSNTPGLVGYESDG